jgi:hypothetical protein
MLCESALALFGGVGSEAESSDGRFEPPDLVVRVDGGTGALTRCLLSDEADGVADEVAWAGREERPESASFQRQKMKRTEDVQETYHLSSSRHGST